MPVFSPGTVGGHGAAKACHLLITAQKQQVQSHYCVLQIITATQLGGALLAPFLHKCAGLDAEQVMGIYKNNNKHQWGTGN